MKLNIDLHGVTGRKKDLNQWYTAGLGENFTTVCLLGAPEGVDSAVFTLEASVWRLSRSVSPLATRCGSF